MVVVHGLDQKVLTVSSSVLSEVVAVDQDTLNQQELVGMLKKSLTFEVYLVYTVQ